MFLSHCSSLQALAGGVHREKKGYDLKCHPFTLLFPLKRNQRWQPVSLNLQLPLSSRGRRPLIGRRSAWLPSCRRAKERCLPGPFCSAALADTSTGHGVSGEHDTVGHSQFGRTAKEHSELDLLQSLGIKPPSPSRETCWLFSVCCLWSSSTPFCSSLIFSSLFFCSPLGLPTFTPGKFDKLQLLQDSVSLTANTESVLIQLDCSVFFLNIPTKTKCKMSIKSRGPSLAGSRRGSWSRRLSAFDWLSLWL